MYNELYHHGILGQKWGKRNGPPYPLDRSDYSAEEKRKNPIKRFAKRAGDFAINNPIVADPRLEWWQERKDRNTFKSKRAEERRLKAEVKREKAYRKKNVASMSPEDQAKFEKKWLTTQEKYLKQKDKYDRKVERLTRRIDGIIEGLDRNGFETVRAKTHAYVDYGKLAALSALGTVGAYGLSKTKLGSAAGYVVGIGEFGVMYFLRHGKHGVDSSNYYIMPKRR